MSCLHSNEMYVAKLEVRTGKGAHLIRNFYIFCLMPAAIPVIVLFNCPLLVTVVPEISEEGKCMKPLIYFGQYLILLQRQPLAGWLFVFFFMYKGVSVT